MMLAGLFAGVLLLGLILGDWLYFVRLTPDAGRYGCGIARSADRLSLQSLGRLEARVDGDGALTLPHGIARYYPALRQIALRPQYHLFSMGFRTAWPLKGLIHLTVDDQAVSAVFTKRIPWSSAIITLVWFLLVGLGTAVFMIMYGVQGGFESLSGVLMGAGILGIGLLVLAFGAVTVVLSYRLENSRLAQVYAELKAAVDETPVGTSASWGGG
jgi:TM2 domain-containing membrane protein YozV